MFHVEPSYLCFRAREWLFIPGRGWGALVMPYTELTDDDLALLRWGNKVHIDLEEFTIRGVEVLAVPEWWRKGFGILVDRRPARPDVAIR